MSTLAEAIQSIDVGVYTWLSGFAGNWILDRLASHEEANQIFKGGIFLAVYWYLWFRIGSDREKRRGAIITVVLGALLAVVVARTISFVVPFRQRPMLDPTLVHPWYSAPITANLETWSGFPSDHASFFFALAFGLAYLLRPFAIPIMLYTATWCCLPRMYLGLHYASDIVAGAAIGMATVWVLLGTEWFQSGIVRRIVAFEKTCLHWFYAIAFLACFEMASVFNDIRSVGHAVLHLAMGGSRHGVRQGDTETLIVLLATTCLILIIWLVNGHVSALYRKRPQVSAMLSQEFKLAKHRYRLHR